MIALLIALTLAAPGPAEIVDGAFESDIDSAWTSVGGAGARLVPAPGWRQVASKFNSGQYESLRLYLRVQTGTGEVCFDDAAIEGLELRNPGFEEAEGNRLVGWDQDNVGETIFSGAESQLNGSRSACIRQTQPGMSRIWQDIECEPRTEYEASVWMLVQGLRGDAYAEIYGLDDGELKRIVWQSDHLSGVEDASLQESILSLRSDVGEEPSGVEQDAEVPAGQNLSLHFEAAVPEIGEGEVAVVALVGGQELGAVRLTQPQLRWGTYRVIIQSPPDGRMTVRITASGDVGRAYIDNVAVGPPGENVSALTAKFVGAARNLVLTDLDPITGRPKPRSPFYVSAEGETTGLVSRGIDMLAQEIDDATEGRIVLERGDDSPHLAVTVTHEPAPSEVEWWWPESYRLRCSQAGVRVESPSEQGALYGLTALAKLLDRDPDGMWQLVAADIEDRPGMPFRGTYMARLPRRQAEREGWCRRLAALKINAVVIEDDIWWRLDDPDELAAAQEAFADFRAYGIDPIPELQSFGWGHIVLKIDPMCAEGQWVEREVMRLVGETPAELANPNVLRTEATDIRLAGTDGTVYVEGKDYRVIDGEIKHIYVPEAAKTGIVRLPGGRIDDGETVYASYDYVAHVNSSNCPYCPSEPRVAQIMVDAIQDTVRSLHPTTVHIGHDEPAVMNSDSRCIKRGMTNAELLAEDVKRLYDAAHEIDPSVRIMMWADAVNPYHNGLHFADDPTSDALDILPKDVILNVWFYNAAEPSTVGAESLQYLAAKGFTTTGSSWDSDACATAWSQECHASRLRGEDCIGVLYTSWGDRWDSLEAAASTAWKPPVASLTEEVTGG